jgi:hypothetical protein
MTKNLAFSGRLSSETCFPNNCVYAIGSSGSHLLESVEELCEEWKRMSIGLESFDGDNIQKVNNVMLVFQS